ncbi:Stp1/IreP family PP2C-type Ser/Thr phosphatase [Sinobaca sp. H24]|uniref:Stp1/IreP family PP2C-type Ser/Thr phosphatase n=1 Tax=Sinobaca sp. H24 TaxID=2923376 RepID=UPI00207B03B1|nr:Stp1/IreP family PP2C-type Ser/Thr phosphatase [Sinobaca sp. H24]
MKQAYKTITGRVRKHNEDAAGIFENQSGEYLAVVCDGMGGHQAGDTASAAALDILKREWEHEPLPMFPEQARAWLVTRMEKVNAAIFELSRQNPYLQGMGTTAVAAICTRGFIAIGHVGDSRAYLFDEVGVYQKTEDHSLVNELRLRGELTEEEAESHPRKNVLTRALGTEKTVKCDATVIEWENGEGVFLCSDGLSNKVTSLEIADFLQNKDSVEEAVEGIVHKANDRGGEDNITIAAVINSFSMERRPQ